MNGVNEKGSAEAATSPSHGSNNPNEECVMNSDNLTMEAAECEVFSLAREHRRVRDESFKFLEISKRSQGARSTYYYDASRELMDLETALEGLICARPASCMEAAAYQLDIALHLLDHIGDGEDAKERQAIERLLYSALGVIRRHCAGGLETAFGERFGNPHCDPFRDVEERLAMVEGAA